MDRIRIVGGRRLNGTIPISGAKNATLPLMAASLLTDQPVTLLNVPYLADIQTMSTLLYQLGVRIVFDAKGVNGAGGLIRLSAGEVTNTVAPYDLVRKMRASVLVLGPLLARCGQAQVSLPGGCAIGTRPVDLHIKGLEQLGAVVELKEGYMHARAPGGLRGAKIVFPKVSVGATENLLMAAVLADGETVLANAAREPEITDLAELLIAMGADISGLGTDTLRVRGVKSLNGVRHVVVPDRIEAGTYAIAAAITGGRIELTGISLELIQSAAEMLARAGVDISEVPGGVVISRLDRDLTGVDIMTEPFPGFPTDLQAQMMSLMTVAQGAAMITETIFENRFMHVPELMRMGANITVHQSSALVRGVDKLLGAPVMATDLRASVSLVLAGLAAEGETIVNRVYHLDRGYDRLEQKLAACGATVERLRDERVAETEILQ